LHPHRENHEAGEGYPNLLPKQYYDIIAGRRRGNGARDLMAPPKNAQALTGALQDKRVVTLPDCGHALMAEQPDAVLDALLGFL
jgi:fermentation-respiration switch protein FrsA (DUF1100 family)